MTLEVHGTRCSAAPGFSCAVLISSQLQLELHLSCVMQRLAKCCSKSVLRGHHSMCVFSMQGRLVCRQCVVCWLCFSSTLQAIVDGARNVKSWVFGMFSKHAACIERLLQCMQTEEPAASVAFSLDEGNCWNTVQLQTALDVQNIRYSPHTPVV